MTYKLSERRIWDTTPGQLVVMEAYFLFAVWSLCEDMKAGPQRIICQDQCRLREISLETWTLGPRRDDYPQFAALVRLT